MPTHNSTIYNNKRSITQVAMVQADIYTKFQEHQPELFKGNPLTFDARLGEIFIELNKNEQGFEGYARDVLGIPLGTELHNGRFLSVGYILNMLLTKHKEEYLAPQTTSPSIAPAKEIIPLIQQPIPQPGKQKLKLDYTLRNLRSRIMLRGEVRISPNIAPIDGIGELRTTLGEDLNKSYGEFKHHSQKSYLSYLLISLAYLPGDPAKEYPALEACLKEYESGSTTNIHPRYEFSRLDGQAIKPPKIVVPRLKFTPTEPQTFYPLQSVNNNQGAEVLRTTTSAVDSQSKLKRSPEKNHLTSSYRLVQKLPTSQVDMKKTSSKQTPQNINEKNNGKHKQKGKRRNYKEVPPLEAPIFVSILENTTQPSEIMEGTLIIQQPSIIQGVSYGLETILENNLLPTTSIDTTSTIPETPIPEIPKYNHTIFTQIGSEQKEHLKYLNKKLLEERLSALQRRDILEYGLAIIYTTPKTKIQQRLQRLVQDVLAYREHRMPATKYKEARETRMKQAMLTKPPIYQNL